MAKSKTTKKTTAKKPASRASKKKASAKAVTSRKKTTTKKTAKKATTSKPAAKKAPTKKKPVKKKATTKKTPARKTTRKVTTKKKTTPKKPAKPASKKKPVTKKTSKKSPARKKTTPKPASKSAAPAKKDTPTKAELKAAANAEAARLKSARDAASRLAALAGLPAVTSSALAEPVAATKKRRLTKSPISPTNLKKYRDVLLQKRNEVASDVSAIEGEALNPSRSGDLSSLPQHMADQGSDEFDQALSLGIAASQRRLLIEIDAAIDRIDNGVYAICELTGSAIHKDRLEATPWCRYSLEGARMADRGFTRDH